MAKRIERQHWTEADLQDMETARKYAARIADHPEYLICRGGRKHVPHATKISEFDDLRHGPNGERIAYSHCERCHLPCKKRFDRDWYRLTGWVWDYKGTDYLAEPGEGYGLVSRAAGLELERMMLLGIPDVDFTAPKARKTTKKSPGRKAG